MHLLWLSRKHDSRPRALTSQSRHQLRNCVMTAIKIEVDLREGDLRGIMTARKSRGPAVNGYAFGRDKHREIRDDIAGVGVYILTGDESNAPAAYIGQSDGVYDRINQHQKKKFWSRAIALMGRELNTSDTQYAESHLIIRANYNQRWILKNEQIPSSDAGKLRDGDKDQMSEVVREMEALVGVLGCDLFRPACGAPDEGAQAKQTESPAASHGAQEFFCRGQGFDAKMVTDGRYFVIISGSKAKISTAPATSPGAIKKRESLKKSGSIIEEGGYLVFKKNCECSSVSQAGEVVSGRKVHGPSHWKVELSDGRKLTYEDWKSGGFE